MVVWMLSSGLHHTAAAGGAGILHMRTEAELLAILVTLTAAVRPEGGEDSENTVGHMR